MLKLLKKIFSIFGNSINNITNYLDEKIIDEVKIYDKFGSGYISLKLIYRDGKYGLTMTSLNGDHVIVFPLSKASVSELETFLGKNKNLLGD